MRFFSVKDLLLHDPEKYKMYYMYFCFIFSADNILNLKIWDCP